MTRRSTPLGSIKKSLTGHSPVGLFFSYTSGHRTRKVRKYLGFRQGPALRWRAFRTDRAGRRDLDSPQENVTDCLSQKNGVQNSLAFAFGTDYAIIEMKQIFGGVYIWT